VGAFVMPELPCADTASSTKVEHYPQMNAAAFGVEHYPSVSCATGQGRAFIPGRRLEEIAAGAAGL
jgi:hypothetical protein